MSKIVNIKCPNCGANLEVKDNQKTLKCQYCNTSLLIEKDINDEIKANILNTGKALSKVFTVVFAFAVVIFIVISFSIFRISNSMFKHTNFDLNSFNNSFTFSNGTQTGMFIKSTLDDVITSNKKHSKHQIYVKYNDIKTNNEDEIIAIKDELNKNSYYEVKVDYDKNEYVNLITIIKK